MLGPFLLPRYGCDKIERLFDPLAHASAHYQPGLAASVLGSTPTRWALVFCATSARSGVNNNVPMLLDWAAHPV